MKKEALKKKTVKLKATPAMMRKAGIDTKRYVPEGGYYNRRQVEKYHIGMYLRARKCDGILKVAIFLTKEMRNGSREPAYELYINKELGDWITWDAKREKWLTAKLDMIEWPDYVRRSGKYANRDTKRTIKSYLEISQGGYGGILQYQLSCREDALKRRYKKETEPWDADMELIPDRLPKNWEDWVDRHGIRQHYLFYEYSRGGAKEGYCTYCKKMVPVEKPKYNDIRICKCCGHPVILKSTKKAGSFPTRYYMLYLLQRTETGFVIRKFSAHRNYRKGTYREPEVICYETRRILYDRDFQKTIYYMGEYKNHEMRWIRGGDYGYYDSTYEKNASIYPYNLASLAEKELKRTGLPETIRRIRHIDPEEYMGRLHRYPVLEQIVKAGLMKLSEEIMRKPPCEIRGTLFQTGTELHKQLKIDKQRLKRLRQQEGGTGYLKWLQLEKRCDTCIKDETIKWYEERKIDPKDLEFIGNRMSPEQVKNYLEKQKEYSYPQLSEKKILGQWEDYLSMCKAAKKDLEDEMVYRPRELKRRHDEMVAYREKAQIMERMQKNQKSEEEYAKKMAEKFPGAEENLKRVKGKYEYEHGEFLIRVPEHLSDIAREGYALHHCAGSSERYFERIMTGETYICFLRKKEDPEIPFYTIEVEPNGTIRQSRTYLDEETSIEQIRPFLRRWQQEIQKRMGKEDYEAQDISARKREENILELQKKGNTRVLKMLMEDFMEVI